MGEANVRYASIHKADKGCAQLCANVLFVCMTMYEYRLAELANLQIEMLVQNKFTSVASIKILKATKQNLLKEV